MNRDLPELPHQYVRDQRHLVHEAREVILLARIAEVEAQRDFLVEEYERAVKCGKQGYLHCAMHLFNAITNARIEAAFAAKEKEK